MEERSADVRRMATVNDDPALFPSGLGAGAHRARKARSYVAQKNVGAGVFFRITEALMGLLGRRGCSRFPCHPTPP